MKLSIVINTYNRKEMLFDLLKSIYKNPPKESYEVVVVDDASLENYQYELKKKYTTVRFFRNRKHQFLIKSRNIGWKKSKGDIVFFIDDDNEIKDKNFFSKALAEFDKNTQTGVLGCRSYYFDDPKRILIGPNRFNKYTGKTYFYGQNKIDNGIFNGLTITHDNPNAFFTTKKVLLKTRGFSEEIVQTFSEADFCEKVRQVGLRVVHFSDLKTYHKSPYIALKKLTLRSLGGRPERVYYFMRNRYLFIKKWGNVWQCITFTLFFGNLINLYYLFPILREKKINYLLNWAIGIRDGYIYVLTGKLVNHYGKN